MKLKKNKNIIFISLFFCALLLNVIAVLKPEVLDRTLIIFIPIPILVVRYYDLAKNVNPLYMISFIFTYSGATVYASRVLYYFNISIMLYLVGILLYVKIILKNISFSKKNIFQFLIFLVLFLVFPIMYVHTKVSSVKLFFMTIYVLGILLFFYTSILLFKSKIYNSKYVLLSSSMYILSTFCTALLIFNYRFPIIHILGTSLFWLTHLFMNIYMTSKNHESKKEVHTTI